MVKVKTINPHSNTHGEKYRKEKGDVYEIPTEAEAKKNAALKLVEIVDGGAAKSK